MRKKINKSITISNWWPSTYNLNNKWVLEINDQREYYIGGNYDNDEKNDYRNIFIFTDCET